MPVLPERRGPQADCPRITEGNSMMVRISLDALLWLAVAINLAVTATLYAQPLATFG